MNKTETIGQLSMDIRMDCSGLTDTEAQEWCDAVENILRKAEVLVRADIKKLRKQKRKFFVSRKD